MEAVLEQVAAALVPAIEGLCVAEGECVHSTGDPLQLAEHHEMEVVAHEAVGEETPFGQAGAEAEQTEEVSPVFVVAVDVATVDTAHRQVVRAEVGKVVAVESRHRDRRYRARRLSASSLSAMS